MTFGPSHAVKRLTCQADLVGYFRKMKTSNLLGIVACFLILAALAGCSPSHPTDKERRDVISGMRFSHAGLSKDDAMESAYSDYLNSGQFIRNSKYFKAGADYWALIRLDQVNRDLESSGGSKDDIQDADKICATAWQTFQQDLATLPMTPQKFSEVVGDANIPTLMAANPYEGN